MGSWLVYLLRCTDQSLYCGMTNNLSRRLQNHSKGKVKYSRGRLPVRVVWTEPAASRGAALRREYQVKQLTRAKKERLVAGAEGKQRVIDPQPGELADGSGQGDGAGQNLPQVAGPGRPPDLGLRRRTGGR